jgi:hypothetical protein
MPIHVTIAINDRVVENVHIARMGTDAGRVAGVEHEYSVLMQNQAPQSDEEWEQGVRFKHAYGTGLMRCVEKGIAALREIDSVR